MKNNQLTISYIPWKRYTPNHGPIAILKFGLVNKHHMAHVLYRFGVEIPDASETTVHEGRFINKRLSFQLKCDI